ncbi:hypothetical protein ABS767_14270 [Sphingomonas sp. ST-64]|uniref:HdeA/HdeB family protein n=1 Tax=Sphingomonas plantiphila TaxID=3163295 RepID=A0ABW8YSU5_9SPHN
MPRRKKLRDHVLKAAAIAAALIAAPAIAAQGKLPPYPEALNCAALTHAASKIGKGTPQESQLFDHLIYWGMAAADSGRAAGKTSKAVDTEVAAQSAALESKLRAQDGATTAALASCVARVPALDN